ncbi:Calcium-dependent protein kinase 28 [Vitis vinifera]|uniref:non-specific serine/threonine protein kinase n=1 Tax=Vitis vinifera TaxID=29760 RepID=A0A438EVF3_VITVI|nr:Calcium-dependent protein kinase 28 [Vitis vinifera]
MGACLSATKVRSSNSNTTANAAATKNTRPRGSSKTSNKNQQKKPQEGDRNRSNQQHRNPQPQKVKDRANGRRGTGIIPCGKRTDLGTRRILMLATPSASCWATANLGIRMSPPIRLMGIELRLRELRRIRSGLVPFSSSSSSSNWMILPIAVEDVKREVKILEALTGHENVVQFHNAFEDDSYVYIVMELCEGGELLDRILAKKDSRYSEKDAAKVVRQMLKVAAECHLHGLVHRDMKPENFLFKSTKEDSPLKATDFGLSDFIKPGKKFQDIVGSAYYVAPEVLRRKSGPESDVWSIGVITYILLCGKRPFWDKTEDGIFKEVLKNKPDFRRKPWPTISNGAKDFVKKLLVKDPRARLTAAQALSHPWVREGGDASEIPIDISVLSNMREFVKYSHLKQFALRALASTLDDEELADLRDQFDAIDVDKNGSISLEEMRQALAKDLPWKMKESRVLEILQAIDSNTDGLVDFTEFVAATLHVHQLEEHDSDKWRQRSQAAFDKFDVDRDGFITPEELKLHTGLRGSIDPLLEEADIDKDGRISLAEFRRLLRTASISSRQVPSSSGFRNPRKI